MALSDVYINPFSKIVLRKKANVKSDSAAASKDQ
jgi:hypothetical protein